MSNWITKYRVDCGARAVTSILALAVVSIECGS
jgi:hypothetical protein